ncbi:hypothetical protein [Blastococcus brunescens]|uniref:Uncharacterized protein n=1 Tax=Blastococcus brunescens TaxID=1564165 RepID=A0ABZ1B445_9ACTN|nr:hypothetical protein [Blastococcus sp. BMG 8361]WRL64638.1 hypothetical protein U6N30_02250 [Blastococcus sp. BMG 8361]
MVPLRNHQRRRVGTARRGRQQRGSTVVQRDAEQPRGARGPVSSAIIVAPSADSDHPGITGSGSAISRTQDPSDSACTRSSVTPPAFQTARTVPSVRTA